MASSAGRFQWRVVALRVPRSGDSDADCDDAYAVSPPLDDSWQDLSPSAVRLAVADGVAVGFFSRLWADALVERYLDFPLGPPEDGHIPADDLRDWLIQAADSLRLRKEAMIVQRREQGLHVVRNAMTTPSFSTLVAIRVVGADASTVCVEAVAIGDSCVLWRPGPSAPLSSFPIADPSDFGNTPPLIPSSFAKHAVPVAEVVRFCVPPDGCIVLATDAVACWLIQRDRDGHDEVAALAKQTRTTWAQYIANARAAHMTVDDSTALVLEFRAWSPMSTSTPAETYHQVGARQTIAWSALRKRMRKRRRLRLRGARW